jgi:hypothetical protein
MLDEQRRPVMEGKKLKYFPVVEIKDRRRRDLFSKAVWDAHDRFQMTGGGNA